MLLLLLFEEKKGCSGKIHTCDLVFVSDELLLYQLECFIGISTTEKNRITTREKFHWCVEQKLC